MLSPLHRQIVHALLTRPPLTYLGASTLVRPFDLHVLSTPPAFILSQDQTLTLIFYFSHLHDLVTFSLCPSLNLLTNFRKLFLLLSFLIDKKLFCTYLFSFIRSRSKNLFQIFNALVFYHNKKPLSTILQKFFNFFKNFFC